MCFALWKIFVYKNEQSLWKVTSWSLARLLLLICTGVLVEIYIHNVTMRLFASLDDQLFFRCWMNRGYIYEYQRNRIIVISTTMIWHTFSLCEYSYCLFFILCWQMSFSASDSALVFSSHSANSYSLFSPTFDLTTPAVPTASQDSNIGKINL